MKDVSKDGSRVINWGKTSNDYGMYRPGPPDSFYKRLEVLGVGLPGQRILDLATGTGLLARQFALQGVHVSGVDISERQIKTARNLSHAQDLEIDFAVSAVENLPWQEKLFDVVTANQCWLYFDKQKTINELTRVLKPEGWLVTSYFSWLPRKDQIASATESLILKHNPEWSAGDWNGDIPSCPEWSKPFFNMRAMFYYDEPVPFTRESWRGRIRACRGVGASMTPEEVVKFDNEHDQLLKKIAPDSFTILHRISAHIFEFKEESLF